MPKIVGLKGFYTGEGFQKKKGRRLSPEDCSFVQGDLCWDSLSGKITESSSDDIVIDGTGLVATPGWIDSHTHALFEGNRYSEFFHRWAGLSYTEIAQRGGGIHNTVNATQGKSEDFLIESLLEKLSSFSRAGTTFLEIKSGYANTAGGELYLLRTLKKARERLLPQHPKYKTTFLALHALPKGKDEGSFVEEMCQALPIVAQEKLADFVDAFPEEGFFSLGHSLEFVKQAATFGLKAKIHSDEITDMKAAEYFTAQGAVSVDHLQKINSMGIDYLSSNPTVATLLPATSLFLGLPYANARALLDRGAQVALATDYNPGTAPELSFSLTHKLAASSFKMAPHEILAATTYNAACALDVQSERGLLLPQYFADILLWKPTVTKEDSLGESYLEEIFLDSLRLVGVFCQGSKAFLNIG